MNKFIIVLSEAGLSSNFLTRILNLSNKVEWFDPNNRLSEIVSKDADNQWINYCYTSDCHTATKNFVSSLIASKYNKSRQQELTLENWNTIKKYSKKPSAWFFHNISKDIYEDEDTVVVRVESGTDFNTRWFLDRRLFGCDEDQIDDVFFHHRSFVTDCCTSISYQINTTFNDGHISFNSSDIFNSTKVINLLKELELYDDSMETILSDLIEDYISKNTRPSNLFTKSAPLEYDNHEIIDLVNDKILKHYLKCVNRKEFTDYQDNTIDPMTFLEDFQKSIASGEGFDESLKKCVDNFSEWGYSCNI